MLPIPNKSYNCNVLFIFKVLQDIEESDRQMKCPCESLKQVNNCGICSYPSVKRIIKPKILLIFQDCKTVSSQSHHRCTICMRAFLKQTEANVKYARLWSTRFEETNYCCTDEAHNNNKESFPGQIKDFAKSLLPIEVPVNKKVSY